MSEVAVKRELRRWLLGTPCLRAAYRTPLHRNEALEPFFIMGSGRSGNTLLRKILNNHPRLCIPPETYVLGACIRQYLRHPRMKWPDLVQLILSNFQFHREFETFRLASLSPLCADLKQLPGERHSVAAVIDGFFQFYGAHHAPGSMRWGDKTPVNVFFLEEIHSVFPRAKFIHMLRNPYDVAHSYVASGLIADVEKATDRWLRSVCAARAFGRRSPDSYMEVEYAELVREPERAVSAVCEFIGVDYSATMLGPCDRDLGDVALRRHHDNVSKPIFQHGLGRGQRELSKSQLRAIRGKLQSLSCQRSYAASYPACRSHRVEAG